MLQEKAAELKALQRSNQDLHAAMVRRRTKQRIQQRAQRGLILQQQQQQQQLLTSLPDPFCNRPAILW